MALPDRTEKVTGLIAANLTSIKSSAALSHYPSLRIQTANLNRILLSSVEETTDALAGMSSLLGDDSAVTEEFRAPGTALSHFRRIGPRIVGNFLLIARKLAKATPPEPKLTLAQAMLLKGSFEDFCDLCTAVRQFVDTLVECSYQLCVLDPAYLNYKVLESLASFVVVAPASLQTPIYSRELEVVVQEYVRMNSKTRKNSDFTLASHEQFPQRVDFLCNMLSPSYHQNVRGNLNSVFKFCSDFAHVGYVSTLVVGSEAGQVYMGSAEDVFYPRSENFAELKLQLLRECALFYGDIFLRALKSFLARLLGAAGDEVAGRVSEEQSKLFRALSFTYRTLVEPIREGLVGGEDAIRYDCNCGGHIEWPSPHSDWDNYCPECGARFVMHEVPANVEYVISASGAGDVTGGTATKIRDLPERLRQKLTRLSEKHKPPAEGRNAVSFIHITDLEHTDEDTLEVAVRVLGVPRAEIKKECQLFTFVSGKALGRATQFLIRCNCGATAPYDVASERYAVRCPQCNSLIGLVVVSGDSTHVSGQGFDGSPCEYPIQGAGAVPTEDDSV